MTLLAGLRKLSGDVVWILRLLKICRVTGNASGRQTLELPDRRSLMAIFALYGGVGSEQRKPILVIFHLLHGDVPALYGVAFRTVCAHFSLMHVVVTVLTILSNVREYRLYVAQDALHFFVHTAQGVVGLVVIKFRNSTNGSPSRGRRPANQRP